MRTMILDMDGTLFDTERVYHGAWLSVGVPEEMYFRMVGRSRQEIWKMIDCELHTDPQVLYGRCAQEKDRRLAGGIPVKTGARELLAYLKQHGYRIALATSRHAVTPEHHLHSAALREYFDAVIGGDQVAHGKPSPEIYEKAAAAVGSDPHDCAAAEDSFNGVRAAHRAGLYTIMVPDLAAPDDEMRKIADAIVPSLLEVPALLEARA